MNKKVNDDLMMIKCTFNKKPSCSIIYGQNLPLPEVAAFPKLYNNISSGKTDRKSELISFFTSLTKTSRVSPFPSCASCSNSENV